MKRGIRTIILIATLLGIFGMLATTTLTSGEQPQPEQRKVFTNSVIPLPNAGGFAPLGLVVNAATDTHKKEKMDILFSLSIPDDARKALEEKILKGEKVDAEELIKNYSAKKEDFDKIVSWLKEEGLEITHTSPDKTSVYARGTVAQIEKSLQVNMVRVTRNGHTYTAAKNAPSLPVSVSNGVQAVIGLQPFRQATKKSRIHRSNTANAAVSGYLVKQVLQAYNAADVGVTGKGQKIAILIDTFPKDADTTHFWTINGLPNDPQRVEKVNVKNVQHLPPVEGEESMDVQWSSGIARDAKVRVYASGSLEFADLDLALDKIIEDAMTDNAIRQVSISLGLGEDFVSPDHTLSGELKIEHDKFTTLAGLGVNVFVSSGDAGSNPDETGHGSSGPLQPEWMATSPFVIGVGGTTLNLAATGGVASEIGWSGSGGGRSKVFPRPPYQQRPDMPSGNDRLVPDVGLLADPATGSYVRVNGHDLQIGGTSLSAPVWAGFCALINESRINANKPPVTFLNPLLYSQAGTDCFRDMKGGISNGAFTDGPGYDMLTGLGVPNIKVLISKINQ